MCVNGDVAAGSGARAAHARALPLCTRGGGRRKGGLPIPAWPPVHLLLRAQIGAGGAKGWGGGRATPVRPQFVYKWGWERHPPLLRQHLWVKGGGKGRWGHTRKGGARREGGTEGKGIGIVNATLTVLDVASVPQNVLAEKTKALIRRAGHVCSNVTQACIESPPEVLSQTKGWAPNPSVLCEIFM
ncbi:hypothetical protein EDB85DRAFT_1891412 [Lactarius pseudohatsudake]|nr:hypothetical protein EDB85DRAFT_1891412 [Lactarius pseudohatsudake]